MLGDVGEYMEYLLSVVVFVIGFWLYYISELGVFEFFIKECKVGFLLRGRLIVILLSY